MKKSSRHSPLKAALAILIYLAEHRFGATVGDLMEETGFKRRNIYRYIKALNEAGIEVVNCSPRGQGYRSKFRLADRPRWGQMVGIS